VIDPDCYYGDHHWADNGSVCSRCGKQLRCICGAFLRADGFDAHAPNCRVLAKIATEEDPT
jgi:hypothetical protein